MDPVVDPREFADALAEPLRTRARTAPFPPEAAAWLGGAGRTVVLVGDAACLAPLAGALAGLGYDVRASVDGTMSLPDRSVDAIISLDQPTDLEVAARVLRPGGQVAVVCQTQDARIPWVRKLRAALRLPEAREPQAGLESPYFTPVVSETFRHWEVVTRDALAEVVRSLPSVLGRPHAEQQRSVGAALELYDDYGRGPDGMQLPWISHCHRTSVLSEAWAMVTERIRAAEAVEAAERAAQEAAAQAAEDAVYGIGPATATEASPDAAAGADRPRDPDTEDTVPVDAPQRPTDANSIKRPSGFDLGDTTEGIITYVVDTGELPAVPAEGPSTSPVAGPVAGPAATAPPEEPEDPDLLIRFR